MPRANRIFLPGHIWHITHRCHKKEFLLTFAKDRQRWLYWLFSGKAALWIICTELCSNIESYTSAGERYRRVSHSQKSAYIVWPKVLLSYIITQFCSSHVRKWIA